MARLTELNCSCVLSLTVLPNLSRRRYALGAARAMLTQNPNNVKLALISKKDCTLEKDCTLVQPRQLLLGAVLALSHTSRLAHPHTAFLAIPYFLQTSREIVDCLGLGRVTNMCHFYSFDAFTKSLSPKRRAKKSSSRLCSRNCNSAALSKQHTLIQRIHFPLSLSGPKPQIPLLDFPFQLALGTAIIPSSL